MIQLFVLIVSLRMDNGFAINCYKTQTHRQDYKFYLTKSLHRSLLDKLHVDNVDSLESCMQMAKFHKGLALNYSPKTRFLTEGKSVNKMK